MKALPINVGGLYGRLTAIEPALNCRWLCLCKCGTYAKVRSSKLVSGETRSCGCLRRELASLNLKEAAIERHRHSGHNGKPPTTEYRIWQGIKTRCYNPHDPGFKWYGAKGVSMLPLWRESFEAFLTYVGPRPSSLYSIDRYPDQSGNYEPGNVRWATRKEQGRNASNNRLITIGGVTRCAAEWEDITGISAHKIRQRLDRGLSPEQAVKEWI